MARLRRQRSLYPKVLILCEGLTEKNYLLEIKNTLPRESQRGIKIEIEIFKKNDPLSLVKEAESRRRVKRVPITIKCGLCLIMIIYQTETKHLNLLATVILV